MMKRVILATGNQSGDLDSVVCSIVHSYCRNVYHQGVQTIPFLNFYKRELNHRKDVIYCLKNANIDPNSLYFVDDLTRLDIESIELLDHNSPQGSILDLVKHQDIKISGIIDHHEDENLYLNANPRIIEKSGSCSSLVFNYWNGLNIEFNNELIFLLSSALIIDTNNCVNKMEKHDWVALESYNRGNMDEMYRLLVNEKNNIDDLSIGQILKKDFKYFENEIGSSSVFLKIGISSTIKSINWFYNKFTKRQFLNESIKFLLDNNLDVLILMNSFTESSEFTKQLIFITNNEKNLILIRLVINSISEELNLDLIEDSTNIKIFNQLNLKQSRKQVAPLIKNSLKEL